MSTSNPLPVLRRPSIPRRLCFVLLALIGAALLFAIAAPQLWYPLWFDQGTFAACAQELQHGGVMYRDCWDVRGPAAVLAYLIPLLASPSPVAVHVFDLLCQAGTAGLLGLLARDMFGRRSGIVAGVLYWLLYASVNYWATAQAESFANLFLVLVLYGAWRGAKPSPPTPLPPGEGRAPSSPTPLLVGEGKAAASLPRGVGRRRFTWLLASGACIGVAFWFKYPFALIGLLPVALILSGTGRLVSRPAKASTSASEPVSSPAKASTSGPGPSSQASIPIPLLQSFALIGVGCAAILLVGFGYFTLTGAISNFQSQLNYDIATFHNVPLSDRLEWLRTIFWEEAVAFVNFGNTPTAGFKDTVQQLTVLGRGYPFVFLLMAWGLLFGLWKRRAATLYAFGYVAVTVAINLWQGHFYRYHFLIVLPAMALLASAADFRLPILDFGLRSQHGAQLGAQSKIENPREASKIVTFVLAIAAVIGLTATMLPWMHDAYENVVVQHKTPGDLYGESRLSSYALVARALNEQTSPDDRIVVFSDVPAVYALAQRRSGTRFPYLRWAQESGSAELRDQYVQEFLDDLTRNQPRFFVLTQPEFPWPGADFISLWKSLPAIHQYVETNYHYVGENGPFLLFMKN